MALVFSKATLEVRLKNKKQWSNVFNIPLNSAKQLIKYEERMKIFLDTPRLQKFTSHTIFLKKLLNVELHQNKSINQKKKRHGGERRQN